MAAPKPDRIPEERVAMILARAAELDRTTHETVGLDALRSAALEAGISPASVDRALEEYAAGEIGREASAADPGTHARSTGFRWLGFRWLAGKLRRPVLQGAIAFLLAALIGSTGSGGGPLIVLGLLAWVGLTLRQAWKDRPTRTAGHHLLRTALTTLGIILGTAVSVGDDGFIALALVIGAALLGSGTLLIKGRPKGAPRMHQSGASA